MDRLTAWLDRALAWPRLSALLLGAVVACGFQPLGLWGPALAASALLIELAVRATSLRQVAVIGWLFGLGLFTVGNNWIAVAFTYQAAMPAWLGWLAVVLLAAYLAVWPAVAVGLGWLVGKGQRLAMVLALGGSWALAEWLRGWLFTGFPWNPLGAILLGPFDRTGAAQLASVVGTYGLSGLTMLLAGAWTMALRPGVTWRRMALAGLPLLAGFMPQWSAPLPRSPRAFTLVQPMIPQEQVNDPAYYEQNFRKLAALSLPLNGQRRLLLWPESGVPDYLRDGYPERFYLGNYGADSSLARRRLGQVAGPQSLLLTGTTDLELAGDRAIGARNVVTVLDGQGAIRGSYAKAHLVPYGEYLPMRSLLTPLGLARLVPGDIDFWPGPGPRTLDLGDWGRAGVQICYEIIFSGTVTDPAHRPDFIFNPSNDGWFGSWGPPQHLAQARLRAVEEGLPVLRSTTTGISALIDADGRVVQHIPRHQPGRIDGQIPTARPTTLFARFGNKLALVLSAVLLALSLVARRRAQR